MKPPMRRLVLSATLALAGAAFAAPPALANPVPHDVVVSATDAGFDPPTVAVQQGGSVTWIERGLNVHTATSLGGAPQAFTTGGFGAFESRSLVFDTPGLYPYTSASDCLNGNNMPGFICGVFYVDVVPPGGAAPAVGPLPTPAGSSTPAAQPTPFATALPVNTVSITDAGISPGSVAVPVGGGVTWTNNGSQVHSATSTGSVPLAFDSGGLGPGQSSQITFPLAGTYTYSSAPDCLNGNAQPGFRCATYTVVVGQH